MSGLRNLVKLTAQYGTVFRGRMLMTRGTELNKRRVDEDSRFTPRV
jgi:hypothetical protein